MEAPKLRCLQAGDEPALYDICLATGDAGNDAAALYRDGRLLGEVFAGPYAALEPQACFVLVYAQGICGYLVGTADSEAFAERCERDWYPELRRRFPLPDPTDASRDAPIVRLIHEGCRPDRELAPYPAHLHVNLLPRAQNRGLGRMLLGGFLDHLRARGVRGVHLETGPNNPRVCRFYERIGFTVFRRAGRGITYVMRLEPPPRETPFLG